MRQKPGSLETNKVESMKAFRTVTGVSTAEFEDRNSRFFGYVAHATTEEEAIDFRHSIRDAIPEASHYVSAWIMHSGAAHYSDAQEPHGTAGLPVYTVIQHSQLEDVVIVVARIFGGTLLGRGGLMRAYTKAAKYALEKAHIVMYAPSCDVLVSVEYPLYQQLSTLIADRGIQVLDTSFAGDVTIEMRVLSQDVDKTCKDIEDLCNGRVEFFVGDEQMQMVDAPPISFADYEDIDDDADLDED